MEFLRSKELRIVIQSKTAEGMENTYQWIEKDSPENAHK